MNSEDKNRKMNVGESNSIIGKHKGKLIVIILLLLSVAIYFLVPNFKAFVDESFTTLSSMDVEKVKAKLRAYGPYAAAVSFILMILQSVAAPIPAFLLTFANASIFGWVYGAILSWTSAMAGAAVCFYISKYLGRDAVEKLTSKGALESVDGFFEKYGKHTVLILRLLPFMSFDLVSYAAGLTPMGIGEFLIATGLGQLPATLVYSYVGGMLTGSTKLFVTGLLILFALAVIIYMIKSMYKNKNKEVSKNPEISKNFENINEAK